MPALALLIVIDRSSIGMRHLEATPRTESIVMGAGLVRRQHSVDQPAKSIRRSLCLVQGSRPWPHAEPKLARVSYDRATRSSKITSSESAE